MNSTTITTDDIATIDLPLAIKTELKFLANKIIDPLSNIILWARVKTLEPSTDETFEKNLELVYAYIDIGVQKMTKAELKKIAKEDIEFCESVGIDPDPESVQRLTPRYSVAKMKLLFEKIANESDNLKEKGSNAANNAVFLCPLKILAEKICYIITMTGRCRRLSSLPYPFHGIVTLQHMFRRLFRDKNNVGLLFRKGTSHMTTHIQNPNFSINELRTHAQDLPRHAQDEIEAVIDVLEPLNEAYTALNRILSFEDETLEIFGGEKVVAAVKQGIRAVDSARDLSYACAENVLLGGAS